LICFESEDDLKLGMIKNEISKILSKEKLLIEKKKEFHLEIISLRNYQMRIAD
jgi:hypothetical protein